MDEASMMLWPMDRGSGLAAVARPVERLVVVVSGAGFALEQNERAFGTGVLAGGTW